MIPMIELKDDYYVFEEERLCLRGKRTNKTYTLGDEIRVKLLRTDVRLRRIDFGLADAAAPANVPKKKVYYKRKKKKDAAKKQFKSYVKKKSKKRGRS